MASGKRLSTDEPLTEHDVAERIDKAALRLNRVLMEIRQFDEEFFHEVRRSRYHSDALVRLGEEIVKWQAPLPSRRWDFG